jgi:hypothetical protein
MRWMNVFWIAASLVALPISQSVAHANQASSVVFGAAGLVLGASASSAALYSGIIPAEPQDWKDPRTDSTAVLAHQCGFKVESRLLTTKSTNLFFLSLTNELGEKQFVSAKGSRVYFGSGLKRFADFPTEPGRVAAEPKATLYGILPFPDKTDFQGQRQVGLSLPIEDSSGKILCSIELTLERAPDVPEAKSTSIHWTSWELFANGGVSFWRTPQVARLGGDFGALFMMDNPLYFSMTHGLTISFFLEGWNGGNAAAWEPLTGNLAGEGRAFGATLYGGALMYSHRHYFSDRIRLIYDVGMQIGSIRYPVAGSSVLQGYTTYSLIHRLNLDWRFARAKWGFWGGSYFLGVSLIQNLFPSGNVAGSSLTGVSTGAMLRLGMGI